ncbi:hypothetical protein [Roseovarius amoyensis]|uniref:hypothetical protein n=1 Tax=Roseovarius amoyensis TaxID=2211448 RepID=UPI000DBE5524|nr:hypothetical protein [Roseovarius amoyensis]
MQDYLPPEIQAGLEEARKRAWRKGHRLRVRAGEDEYPVLGAWEDGFAVTRQVAGHLRGHVTLYDGARLIADCLIVAAEEEDGGEAVRFEYKRVTEPVTAPPADFERAPDAPVALIGRDPER